MSLRSRITLARYRRGEWSQGYGVLYRDTIAALGWGPPGTSRVPVGLLDSLQPVTSRYGALQRTAGDVDNSGGYRVRHDGAELSGSWPAVDNEPGPRCTWKPLYARQANELKARARD